MVKVRLVFIIGLVIVTNHIVTSVTTARVMIYIVISNVFLKIGTILVLASFNKSFCWKNIWRFISDSSAITGTRNDHSGL